MEDLNQKEQLQEDLLCVLDFLDDDILDSVCNIVVIRCNLMENQILEKVVKDLKILESLQDYKTDKTMTKHVVRKYEDLLKAYKKCN